MPRQAAIPVKRLTNPSKQVEPEIPCVQRNMRIHEIITLCPEAAEVMAAYGLHCFSCSIGGVESLQEGCGMHGFDEDTIDALVDDLNDLIRQQPIRPAELIITDSAAEAVQEIAKQEGHEGQGLDVALDASGGFCMEFKKRADKNDAVFTSKNHPKMKFFASPLTLWRIGGATIDFREDRFKLDLPEDGNGCCSNKPAGSGCCKDTGAECGCKG